MILGHAEECQVTRERVELLNHIQMAYTNAQPFVVAADLASFLGASVEYFDGGDQEVENCTCEAKCA